MTEKSLLGKSFNSLRPDGKEKQDGYFGKFKTVTGKDMTEYTTDVHIDGKRVYMPLVVPTLNYAEIEHLRQEKGPTMDILKKSQAHALKRMKAGKSPYWSKGEAVHALPVSVKAKNEE